LTASTNELSIALGLFRSFFEPSCVVSNPLLLELEQLAGFQPVGDRFRHKLAPGPIQLFQLDRKPPRHHWPLRERDHLEILELLVLRLLPDEHDIVIDERDTAAIEQSLL